MNREDRFSSGRSIKSVMYSFQERKKVLPRDEIIISTALLHPGPLQKFIPIHRGHKKGHLFISKISTSCSSKIYCSGPEKSFFLFTVPIGPDQALTPLPFLWF
jgi:hypothetical protein